MGDYGFGVLVQNNTGNKSAFPVRIHPHLQPPHHHQNVTPSPAAFINSTTAGNGSTAGSPWLFPAATAHNNVQDDMGSDKPKAQQQELQETQEKQQLSPVHQEGGIISELEKVRTDESKPENGTSEGTNGKEKLRLESPVLSPFDYQEPSGLGTAVQSSTSSSSLTGFNNWSAAIAPTPSAIVNEDVGFFTPASNGPLLFQNFSHHVGPGFGGSFSPQISAVSQHHAPPPHPHFQHQQHRRSPASPHNPPPFPHRGATFGQLPHLSSGLSKPPSPWGAYPSPSPSPSSASWSPGGGAYGSGTGWGGSRGGDFRRGLNGAVTPLSSVSPLKKTFPNNHSTSQKYTRPGTTFTPKTWMDETVGRSDNVFPFQV